MKVWLGWHVSRGGLEMEMTMTLLFGLTLEVVAAQGHTALYNGGSPWADYWLETLKELRPRLLESGYTTDILMSEFNNLYSDPRFWTSAIHLRCCMGGRKPTEIAA